MAAARAGPPQHRKISWANSDTLSHLPLPIKSKSGMLSVDLVVLKLNTAGGLMCFSLLFLFVEQPEDTETDDAA